MVTSHLPPEYQLAQLTGKRGLFVRGCAGRPAPALEDQKAADEFADLRQREGKVLGRKTPIAVAPPLKKQKMTHAQWQIMHSTRSAESAMDAP